MAKEKTDKKLVIRTLAKSIREYKKETIITPTFILFEAIMECLIPLIVSRFINELQKGVGPYEIFGYEVDNLMIVIGIFGAMLVAIAMISLLCGTMAAKFGAKAGAGFAKNLRHDVYYKIQSFSFENIDKFSTSSLVTRLTTDITNIQMAFQMIIRMAIRSPLMLFFSVVLSFTYHPTLPLVFLVVIPILGVGMFLIIWKTHPLFEKVFKRYDRLNENVQENVRGMRVVKSYVREDYEIDKFEKTSASIEKDFVKAERIMGLMNPLLMFAMYVCMTLLAYLGARIIISSGQADLNIGDLTSLTTYTVQMLASLMIFSFVFLFAIISSESCKRVSEILREEPTITNPENPIYEIKNGDIDFDDVSFKYSKNAEKYALKDINLHIKSGETIGILGGTGSSKSTLIQLISRLYDTTDGTVKVSDHDVKEYDLKTLRDQVAVVLQKNVLFSGTIKENLRWGNKEATDEEMVEACKLAQADEFIETFPNKYDTYIEQGGSNVSGGQKQRLCIARALLKKPKILILDDSTSAVDTKTDALIRKGFKEFIPETTKIIIAQRISSVEDADKIIVMDNGEINAIGTHEELLKTNDIYKEVYLSQNRVNGKEAE